MTSSSSTLIRELNLEQHPEGGYFCVTNSQEELTVSPFTAKQRPLATSIYYLLSYETPNGTFHLNKSVTYHVLHQGRAEYTLITPGNSPKIEKKIMGTNVADGETRLLVVGTGVWKKSSLLEEDIKQAKTTYEKEAANCLITEVVVPGFDWEDHRFMDRMELENLFAGVDGGETKIQEFSKFISK